MDISIRLALASDIDIVSDFFRAMLLDMATYGGHAVATDAENWKKVVAGLTDEIQREDCFWYLAEDEDNNVVGTCGGFIVKLEFGWIAKKNLHIGAVYVQPGNRIKGVGRRLMQQALLWGKEKGCDEVQLNVLENNPARYLYENMGFKTSERKLVLSDY